MEVISPLILKRGDPSRRRDNDYDVLEDGKVVARHFLPQSSGGVLGARIVPVHLPYNVHVHSSVKKNGADYVHNALVHSAARYHVKIGPVGNDLDKGGITALCVGGHRACLL